MAAPTVSIQWDDAPPAITPSGPPRARATAPPGASAAIKWDDASPPRTGTETPDRILPSDPLGMALEQMDIPTATRAGLTATTGPKGPPTGGFSDWAGTLGNAMGLIMPGRGVVGEGGTVRPAGRSLFQRLAGSEPPSPERTAVLEAARRQEIPLTVSAESGSRMAAALERFPERSLMSGKAIPQAREATRKGAEAAVERVAESVGGGIPSEVGGAALQQDMAGQRARTGQAIQEGLRGAEKKARAASAELYDAAYASAPAEAVVAHTKTADVANKLLEQEMRLRGVARPAVARPAAGLAQGGEAQIPQPLRDMPPTEATRSAIETFIEQYGLRAAPSRPLTDTVEIMQRLRGLVRRQPDDSTRRGLSELATALSRDIDSFAAAQGGQFANRLRQADAFYRTEVAQDFAKGGALRGMSRLPDPAEVTGKVYGDEATRARVMARLPEDSPLQARLGLARPGDPEGAMLRMKPDTVVQSLTQGKAGNVGDLPRIWPSLTTETQGRVRQSLVQSLLDDARKGPGEGFSQARFLSAKRKIPDSVMPIVMGENPDRALNEIARVLERVERFDRQTANPSGTGQALIQGWEILHAARQIARGAVTSAAGGLVGPPAIGRFMTSPMARKLFTPEGLATIRPEQRPAAVLLRWLLVPATTPSDQPPPQNPNDRR